MGTSSITITALTATPTLRGNKLKATVLATGPAANLPNLTLKTVVFKSSIVNDEATSTEIARGNPEALDAGLIEEQTYYYWAFALDNSDNVGTVFPVSPTAGVACTAIGMSGLTFGLANGKLIASVAANALTIAVKTTAGNDPSAGDPVYLAFAGATATIGNYRILSITAALSLIISSGSNLGIPNAVPFRIWIVIFDDAGTLRLGAIVCSVGGSSAAIYPLAAEGFASSVAEGGVGGATNSGVIYTGIAVSSKPFRILGSIDYPAGLASPGVYDIAPPTIRLFGLGSHKPGDVVADLGNGNAANGTTGTITTPLDNTIPQQATEGVATNFGVQTTPSSPINFYDFDVVFNVVYSVASPLIGAMYRDNAANAFGTCWGYAPGADLPTQLVFRRRVQAADASARTYNFKIGGSNAGTLRIGATSGGAALGGTLQDFYGVKEIMG